MISVTRRYRFSASHRLYLAELNEAENTALFGKCSNPFGHGHDYVLEVTASGEIDHVTGQLLHVPTLDALVQDAVLSLFSYRNINLDVPAFSGLIATTENVALVIAGILQEAWPSYFSEQSRACLTKVHVQETKRNGFEVRLGVPDRAAPGELKCESVVVHA